MEKQIGKHWQNTAKMGQNEIETSYQIASLIVKL